MLYRTVLLCAVVTAGAFAQLSVSVNPQKLNLAAVAGSHTPAVQTFTLMTLGGNVSFEATVRYLTQPTGWLAVGPTAGTTPAVLTLYADASALPAGEYFAQVAITVGRIGTVVNVVFTVGSLPATATLVTDASALTFLGQSGVHALPLQKLQVREINGGAVRFNVSASSLANWLTASPLSAITPATLTIGANQAALTTGVHSGAITIAPTAGGNATVVPVTLSAKTGALIPTLTLSQNRISLNHQLGTADPPTQAVTVLTAGTSVQYTASTSTGWLRLMSPLNLTPAALITDTTPSDFIILADPAGLVPGNYIGTINVASPGFPSQQVSVGLAVTTTPALNADVSLIAFDVLPGSAPDSRLLTITSTGSSAVEFTASIVPVAAWVTVTPDAGSTAAGYDVIEVAVTPAALAPGKYSAALKLAVKGTTDASLTIPIVLTVGAASETNAIESLFDSIELESLIGGSNPSRALPFAVASGATGHPFTAAGISAGGWLTVSPHLATAPGSVTVTANASAVREAGTYEGTVVVTSLLAEKHQTVAVKFKVGAQSVVAEPAALAFEQQQRGPAPAPQEIRVVASPASVFSVNSDFKWITVKPAAGSTPSTISVSADPTGLAPGVHRGTIKIQAANNQISVPIALTVPEPLGPTASPASLSFSYKLGSPPPAPQPISIGSTGIPVSFTAAAMTDSGGNWLNISAASGTSPATVNATVNTAALIPGKYTGKITVDSTDGSAPSRTVAVTLEVTASAISLQAILHAATGAPTAIAPGQILKLTGAGLGPAAGVTARATTAGVIESVLGGVRVLFDGVPAPLLYVEASQLNAIAPYSIHGRLSSRVQVESGTNYSMPIEVKVVDAAPGIFTASGSGLGHAAALNSDFGINSITNPAQRGSVITVFATGEGQVDPPGQEGRIVTTDLRRPLLPVTATIAGKPAAVTYAGSAPGQVSGIFQVNIRVPDDIQAGNVPVQIVVGASASQSGVTIAVR